MFLRRTQTRTAAIAAGALLTLTLTACGGGDDEPAAAEPTATESSDATDEASPSLSEPSESPTDGESADAEVTAFLDRLKAGFGDEGSVHVSMRMTGPQTIEAEGDTAYGPDGSDLRMTMLMPGMGEQEITMIVSDERVFVSMPGMTPQGKFFEIAKDDPLYSQFGNTGMSPADSFAGFEAGLERVEPVGPDEVAGEQTEHVKLHVDAARALEAQGMGQVPGLPETLVYDLWLDEQDRMRRIRYALAGTKVVMDMTQWGSEVRIDAPPKSEIVDAPQVAG
jgi:hypothetical protein